MPIAKSRIFFGSLFFSFWAIQAWPKLGAPQTPAPMQLLLRPVIPLQELLQLAQKNESYAQIQILRENNKRLQRWCGLPQEKRPAQRRAWLSGLDSYQRALDLSRRRFDQKVRAWISRILPEYRQKGLLEVESTILALQEKRHSAILESLKNGIENLQCGQGSVQDLPPPKLHYKALYLARYEFWKRLNLNERLLLQRALRAK